MVLNHIEIKKFKLIEEFDEKHFKNSSYDLRVEEIISLDGKVHSKYQIEPNSMVIAVSREKIKLSEGILGHAFVKTRLSQKGIMANNIGLVDSDYDGYLSSVLVNFGKEPYEIKQEDTFLRLTFSEFSKLKESDKIPLGYGPFKKKEYLADKRGDALTFLGNAFINTKEISDRASSEVKATFNRIIGNYAKFIALCGLIIAACTFGYRLFNEVDVSSEYKNYVNEISSLETVIKSMELEQKTLLKTIEINNEKNRLNENRVDSLIKAQTKKVKVKR